MSTVYNIAHDNSDVSWENRGSKFDFAVAVYLIFYFVRAQFGCKPARLYNNSVGGHDRPGV